VLFDHDAATMDKRLDALARAVCDRDPRTLDQRRADAMGAIMAGADHLPCACGSDDCLATGTQPNAVLINVIAEQKSMSDDTPVVLDGEDPDRPTKPVRERTLAEAAAIPAPNGPAHTSPAVMIGGPVIPAPLLAAKVAAGATIRLVIHPGDAPPEPHYRPSTNLDRFVRCRDMTCRFPGCREPAEVCDLDHTISYPVGPTCASNLKCLCRKHHLLKTFWCGRIGWRDEQLTDGTVVWTAPSGRTYTTRPGSYALFPKLCDPTAPVAVRARAAAPQSICTLTMPRRKRTRMQDRAGRINAERQYNENYCAERRLSAMLGPVRDKPPPF
jgi:hypothetical protein